MKREFKSYAEFIAAVKALGTDEEQT